MRTCCTPRPEDYAILGAVISTLREIQQAALRADLARELAGAISVLEQLVELRRDEEY